MSKKDLVDCPPGNPGCKIAAVLATLATGIILAALGWIVSNQKDLDGRMRGLERIQFAIAAHLGVNINGTGTVIIGKPLVAEKPNPVSSPPIP